MTRRIIQIYRGTSAQNDAFTGEAGELTMDTTNNELRIHDGLTQGGHKIGTSNYHPDLFDRKWSDHILNDVQWLRADTFSWQDGGVYEAAYNHLVDDIDGKNLQSETVGSTTVQFYLADDGHKICPASEASNVAAIYTATGVAWYYILDTANQRFKLPRSKHNKEDTDQYKYLYFYVGNFTQTALENTAGLNAELFNEKADLDFGNTSMIDYIVEKQNPTAGNNYTWYRKYKSGWVEQGGVATITSNGNSITLPIGMTDTNYDVFSIVMTNTGAYNRCYSKSTAAIGMASSGGNNTSSWMVCGKAAS